MTSPVVSNDGAQAVYVRLCPLGLQGKKSWKGPAWKESDRCEFVDKNAIDVLVMYTL